ncbi:serine/threonine protein kinase [Streptomyces sp. NBC_01537]|uniref:protein kinase domain-containing protein n=1 Tax=Streptomyces sp. NBC_01537 TaxID=2903896 RepID=UPI00386A303E
MVGNTSGEVRGRLVVGRYRLGGSIGQGGMGRVWRAVDEVLDRPVAVKEMRIDDLEAEDARIRRERAMREARATARIDHPNVVRVYDVVQENDRLWIVMELVDGRSLEQILVADGPVAAPESARIGLGLAAALREVHAVGVLHRDIKPGNVLVEASGGRVVLTDFGIAAIQDAAALTMVGMLVGSPDYMAPERVEGRRQGPPSDLWSLGATLCAALAGHSPFARPTTLATLHAVLYEEPQLPPEAGPLRDTLAALLRKDPEARLTLDELCAALRPLADPVPVPPEALPEAGPEPEDAVPPGWLRERRNRRRRLALGAVSGVAVAAVAATVVVLTAGHTGTREPQVLGTSRPPASSSAPAATVSPSAPAAGTRNETGFSWVPPDSWTRTAKSPSNIHYHSPDGTQEIAASYALAGGGDLLTQWQQAEAGSHDVPDYRKIRLERTTFRGKPGVVWEYTFTENGTPMRARQLGFTSGGKTYQLNIWFAASVRTAALRTYDSVTASFTPL